MAGANPIKTQQMLERGIRRRNKYSIICTKGNEYFKIINMHIKHYYLAACLKNGNRTVTDI